MKEIIIGIFIGLFLAHVGTAHSAELILDDGTVLTVTVAGSCSAENPNGCEIGSDAYCTYYQDQWDGMITFESINFQRSCDSNDDGQYNYCDDYVAHRDNGYTFQDQWHYRMCEVYEARDFNPVRNRIREFSERR